MEGELSTSPVHCRLTCCATRSSCHSGDAIPAYEGTTQLAQVLRESKSMQKFLFLYSLCQSQKQSFKIRGILNYLGLHYHMSAYEAQCSKWLKIWVPLVIWEKNQAKVALPHPHGTVKDKVRPPGTAPRCCSTVLYFGRGSGILHQPLFHSTDTPITQPAPSVRP